MLLRREAFAEPLQSLVDAIQDAHIAFHEISEKLVAETMESDFKAATESETKLIQQSNQLVQLILKLDKEDGFDFES